MANQVQLVFDQRLYCAEAIQKAAYRGMQAFTLDIQSEGERYVCVLQANITTAQEAFDKAVEEFRKDVLDYQLRAALQAETAPIRNLIMGIAFSSARLNRSE